MDPQQHDPDIEVLVEVFSGHGNSEEYRDFQEKTARTALAVLGAVATD